MTTDAVIAGVHFFPDEDPRRSPGRRWRSTSPISSPRARAARLSHERSRFPEAPERRLAREVRRRPARARKTAFGCQLAGGDTDRTPGPLSVSITAFGLVPAGGMVRRATARPGDLVYVSGTIGDAALGLALRRDPAMRDRCGLADDASRYLDGKFSRPQPAGRAGTRSPRLRLGGDGHFRRPHQGLRSPMPCVRRRRPHRGVARAAVGCRWRRSRRGRRDRMSI